MSKTIEEIKAEVAKEYIKSGERSTIEQLMTEVAKRYAKSQTQEIQEQNAELVSFLQFLSRKGGLGLDVHAKIDNLLTKYNHLKSNTNETDKI